MDDFEIGSDMSIGKDDDNEEFNQVKNNEYFNNIKSKKNTFIEIVEEVENDDTQTECNEDKMKKAFNKKNINEKNLYNEKNEYKNVIIKSSENQKKADYNKTPSQIGINDMSNIIVIDPKFVIGAQ